MTNASDKPVDPDNTITGSKITSSHKFVSPGILLFVDQLLTAAGGWIYWLVISRLATTSEIGQATTIYSLVMITTMIAQLGLEYPLLRNSHTQRVKILGTVMTIELAITAILIPIVLYAIGTLYQEPFNQLGLITISLLIFTLLGFIARFALLGISNVKNVLIFDVIGTAVKFVLGYFLVLEGMGVYGIIVSFLLHSIVVAAGTLLIALRSFRLELGDLKFFKEITIEGLVNMPSKLSRMFIISLSIILLAFLGVTSSDTGIFYMAIMISLIAGGFASSIAFMVIPASSETKNDLSSGGMRIGLSFTSPIIVLLISAPKMILSLLGPQYEAAELILLILSISVLPSAIVTNAISKFNNVQSQTKIMLVGFLQLAVFIATFFVLVPIYGTIGAAVSVLLAFAIASIPSLIWIGKESMRHVGVSSLSVLLGGVVGYSMNHLLGTYDIIGAICGIAVSMGVVISLKNTSVAEVISLTKMIRKK